MNPNETDTARLADATQVAAMVLNDNTPMGAVERRAFLAVRRAHPNFDACYTEVEARAAIAVAVKRAESRKLFNLYTMLRNMLECKSPTCYAKVDVDDDFIAAVDAFEWGGWEDCSLNDLDCHVSEVLPGLKLARERAAGRDPFDRGDAPSGADNTDLSSGRAIEAREWNGGRR